MKLIAVILLVGCYRSMPPPAEPEPSPNPTAPLREPARCRPDAWLLLKKVGACTDKDDAARSIPMKQQDILEVVEGRYAGLQIVAYGGVGAITRTGEWNISRHVTIGELTACEGPVGPRPFGGAINTMEVGTLQAFRDEASAREALADGC